MFSMGKFSRAFGSYLRKGFIFISHKGTVVLIILEGEGII